MIDIPPEGDPRAVMVWLHGLGADGHDLEPVAAMLDIPGLRHLLPHAPTRPVTLNGGLVMRAWYDIAAPDLQWREDTAGMQDSARAVKHLVETLREDTGLPVIVGGFSQGGVISLATAALGAELLGVVVLSGYLPGYLSPVPEALSRLPVFMAHGRQDPVVPYALAHASAESLRHAGALLDWHAYDMPHAICGEEIDALEAALGGWLQAVPGQLKGL
jgi:phospholipase/carboxylesterase